MNTRKNLAIRFHGGRPPRFIDAQQKVFTRLSRRPTAEAAPIVAKITDEYLKRIEVLGAAKFRTSPLQAVQVPLVQLMSAHVGSNLVLGRLEAFAASPLVKEYARGRAIGAVVGRYVGKIRVEDDADGTKRGKVLIDRLIGTLTLPKLLRAPARMRSLATWSVKIVGDDPLHILAALQPAATTPAARYAVDHAFLAAIARKQVQQKKTLSDDEGAALVEAAGRWLKEYRPVAVVQKYTTDVVGDTVTALGGYPGNDALATLLKENGVTVRKYVEPKKRPPGRPRGVK